MAMGQGMTNELFREVLDGRVPPPAPLLLDEGQSQALLNIFRAAAFQDFIEPLIEAGIITQPLPTDPRARAIAAKAARGKGPQQPSGWRGRERNTKYRSR